VNTVPKHWPYNYTIDLVERTQPPFGRIYNLSQSEFATFCEYLKGFIQHSKSPVGAFILFIKKKDGYLWMCVDYCELNRPTIKNQYICPWSQGCWTSLIMPRCPPRLIYVDNTT
jgi:hypothetical protein